MSARRPMRWMLYLLVITFPGGFADAAVWGEKPVLSVLVNVPEGAERLQFEAGLTPTQADAVVRIARDEQAALGALRGITAASAFNGEVKRILDETDAALAAAFDHQALRALRDWVERGFEPPEALGPLAVSPSQYTFRVFATQFAGHDHLAPHAAVPDRYIKFANLGLELNPGYVNPPYRVHIDVPATGQNATVDVLDVGPWNIDDNYWNTTDAPRPRRMFSDLPQGTPESQAAYFYGYNNGRDQYGRMVVNPAGIDLTLELADQLGLAFLQNAWVNVTFLWEREPVPTAVWPGDTNADGIVNELDLIPIALYHGFTGPPRSGGSAWEAQSVDPWPEPLAAHADADGDGTVDDADLDVVELNWGSVR